MIARTLLRSSEGLATSLVSGLYIILPLNALKPKTHKYSNNPNVKTTLGDKLYFVILRTSLYSFDWSEGV